MSKGFDRKFDTWNWSDMSEASDTSYSFDVRMSRPENMAKGEGEIEYYIKYDDPPIHVKAPTLEKLQARLDERMRSWLSVEWKPKLLILVRHENKKGETSLTLDVTEFEEGTATRDGKLWWRWRKDAGRYDDTFAHRGSIIDAQRYLSNADHDYEHYTTESDKVRQQEARRARRRVVDDTPENRAALDAIRAALVQLSVRLDTLLSANVIQETLKNVTPGLLLMVEPAVDG